MSDVITSGQPGEPEREGAQVVDIITKRTAAPAEPSASETAPESTAAGAPNETPAKVVDGPSPAGPGYMDRVRASKRLPIVPTWLRSTAELKDTVRWVAGHYGHALGYHVTRSPLYAGKLVARAPQGMARFIGGTARWVVDAEGEPLRLAEARRENTELYLKLSRQRDGRVKLRTCIALAASVFGLGFALFLYVAAPDWLLAVSLSATVTALGWLGAPADQPIASRAVVAPKVQKLTSDIVLRALRAVNIGQINQAVAKGGDALTFTAPITRDGPGWLAEGDLPYGVTVTDIIDKRDKLASGLRRPLGCVWPEAVPHAHTGRLRLWVGDQDMNKTKQPLWPLLKAGQVDLFKSAPFGTDQRGRWVELTLMYIAAVIGAIPRMGKTFLLRLLLLISALDPRAALYLFDLKGTGDLSPLECCAHRYRAGDDEDDILYAVHAMRGLRDELRRRARVIRELPRDICPESKVTSELASKKSLGLHPIVVGVDECQVWFEHPKYGRELTDICTDLVKRGPATGIVLMLATQRPDADSLPKGISANASTRFCLKVMSHTENDMVLGTGAYSRGIQATMLAWGDKGIHYFLGEGEDARIVRAAYADAPTAERIARRARVLREKAGTLSGHALGEAPEVDAAATFDLLADVLAVVGDEGKVWSETVTARLAELRPDAYGAWGPEQLTAALKPHGVTTGQVWGTTEDGKGANRRGVTRAHVAAAITERDRKRGES